MQFIFIVPGFSAGYGLNFWSPCCIFQVDEQGWKKKEALTILERAAKEEAVVYWGMNPG